MFTVSAVHTNFILDSLMLYKLSAMENVYFSNKLLVNHFKDMLTQRKYEHELDLSLVEYFRIKTLKNISSLLVIENKHDVYIDIAGIFYRT